MKIVSRNILEIKDGIIIIPTNGNVKKNGKAVMGAGLAKKFLLKYPGADKTLGDLIKKQLKSYLILKDKEKLFIALPTKRNFWNKSDPKLIESSLKEMMAIASHYPKKKIYLPFIGCGLGGLSWVKDVRPIILKIEKEYNRELIMVSNRITDEETNE